MIRRVGILLAAVASAGALLIGTTGCHRICHGSWYHDGGPGCVLVK